MKNQKNEELSIKLNEVFIDESADMQEQITAICNHLLYLEDAINDLHCFNKEDLLPLESAPSESISNAVQNLYAALRVIKRVGV